MYTTRPLSLYKSSPEALSQPPDGPNSGYLVIQDEESTPTCCFGLCKNPAIQDLPFPQNKLLSVEYTQHNAKSSDTSYDRVYLIPVINQPLSSNLYYAIKADGKRKGEAYASSKEEDKILCCFCIPCIKDAKPRSFDHRDIYQQFQFSIAKTFFNSHMLVARSIAPDGHPPTFLRRNGWTMNGKTPKNFTLGEANGINSSLRARLPNFNFPVTLLFSENVIVGKWYCPFMFINEGSDKERIKTSVFYEMTLEQRWERVFNVNNKGNEKDKFVKVTVDVVIPTRVVRTFDGERVEETYRKNDNEVVWFTGGSGNRDDVGLSKLIVDRMVWEEEKFGWIKGEDNKEVIRVIKEEVYEGVNDWRSFGSYVLVESFVLKRNDGNLVMYFDFMHVHNLRSKWE